MHKEIFEIDGKIIIEDENGKKNEVKVTKSLLEILKNKNNIEYLEGNISKNENKIEKIKKDIEGSLDVIKSLKVIQTITTIGFFVGSIVVAKFSNFSGCLLVALTLPPVSYGLFEIPKQLLRKSISKGEKKIDYYIISNALLSENLDVEKEKEKKLPKLVIKKPTFKVTQVDDTELNKYIDKYNNLADLYNSIEVIEDKAKVKKYGI